jgi:hypothetical protein
MKGKVLLLLLLLLPHPSKQLQQQHVGPHPLFEKCCCCCCKCRPCSFCSCSITCSGGCNGCSCPCHCWGAAAVAAAAALAACADEHVHVQGSLPTEGSHPRRIPLLSHLLCRGRACCCRYCKAGQPRTAAAALVCRHACSCWSVGCCMLRAHPPKRIVANTASSISISRGYQRVTGLSLSDRADRGRFHTLLEDGPETCAAGLDRSASRALSSAAGRATAAVACRLEPLVLAAAPLVVCGHQAFAAALWEAAPGASGVVAADGLRLVPDGI